MLLTGATPVAVSPAVVGMGGVGKTMLAATFAYQNQAAFPGGIFWLNMEQPDLIAGQVAACAGPGGLDLADFPALSFEDRIARVRAAWNSPVRRRLVLDNLEDPVVLTRWQPTGSGTRVLITTRCDDWSRQVQRLRLPVLLRPWSVELLLGARAADQGARLETLLAEERERRIAAAICDLLGDLPLALAIAAALLRLNPSQRLRDFHAQIMADPLFTAPADSTTLQAVLREAGLPTGRERGVGATFALSYRQLQAADALDATALRVLHAAAYCAPTPIAPEALWQAAALDPASAEGRSAGDAATRRLRRLGLVDTQTEYAGAISLHRLLAAFVRQQPHAREVLGATATALANHTRALQDAGQIKRSLALVPHLESVLAHQLETQGVEHPDTLSTAVGLAGTLFSQGGITLAPGRATRRCWRRTPACSARSTPPRSPRPTTWPSCCIARGTTLAPGRATRRCWRRTPACSARSTPTRSPRPTTWHCLMPAQLNQSDAGGSSGVDHIRRVEDALPQRPRTPDRHR